MTGEADEANLAHSFSCIKGLNHTALGVSEFRIVVIGDGVYLPQIKVIGL